MFCLRSDDPLICIVDDVSCAKVGAARESGVPARLGMRAR